MKARSLKKPARCEGFVQSFAYGTFAGGGGG